MTARLNINISTLELTLLKEAAQRVPQSGFTNITLLNALKSCCEGQNINDQILSQMFKRGFPIALVEYIVGNSNLHTQNNLLKKYGKEGLLCLIEQNEDNYLKGRYQLPHIKDVAVDSMLYKLDFLSPYLDQWPSAVALECSPSNIPYTAINMAKFIDTTAYVMERVENFSKFMEPIKNILSSRMMDTFIPTSEVKSSNANDKYTKNMEFIRSSMKGVPLSSGPFMGENSLSFPWFSKRAKIAALYSLSITSVLGDTSIHKNETKSLIKSIAGTIF